jgi:alpha-D-ribose 1-methylphosphonate 5-triphosphate synthase subunit PhnH
MNRPLHRSNPNLLPGFADPVGGAQQVFRALLQVFSEPGTLRTVPGAPPPPTGLSPAANAIALALLDAETPVWLDPQSMEAAQHLRFHCGCPLVAQPESAQFAMLSSLHGFAELCARLHAGSDEAPETGATLLLEVPRLVVKPALGDPFTARFPEEFPGPCLTGPGIRDWIRLDVGPDAHALWEWVSSSRQRFPQGIDLILCCGPQMTALPRSLRIRETDCAYT